jgi:hypothetical protein
MASTYTPIATTTLGSNQSSVTFSSISGAYTDLIVVMNGKNGSATNTDINFKLNSDSGDPYSFTYLYGNGTVAASGRVSNYPNGRVGYYTTPGTTDGYMAIVQFMNYSNTTTNKTIISRGSSNSSNTTYPGTETIVNLWRSTSAITSIAFNSPSSSFATGFTFTLYGVKSA